MGYSRRREMRRRGREMRDVSDVSFVRGDGSREEGSKCLGEEESSLLARDALQRKR